MSTLNGQNNNDEALLQAVEQIVLQELDTPHDPHSPLGFGTRLAATVPQPDAAFADQLEARLVTEQRKEVPRMHRTNRHKIVELLAPKRSTRRTAPAFRMATIAATAVLLMVGLVAAVPPARAWAQDTVNDLLVYFGFQRGASGLGVPVASASVAASIQVYPNSMPSQQPSDCVTMDTGGTMCGYIPSFLTQDQAEAQVGFLLKKPTYLPPNYVGSSKFVKNSANIVTWSASKPPVEGRPETICDPGVELKQVHPVSRDAQPAYIGNAAATPITVAGHSALLIENLREGIWPCGYGDATGKQGTVTPVTNVLVWEQDDVRYYLSADARLGRDELIKVAESLR